MRSLLYILLVLTASLSCSLLPQKQDAEFISLAENYIQELLESYPEIATQLGDHRYDHLLNDYSAEAVRKSIVWAKKTLNDLSMIDPSRLSQANAVDYEILRNQLEFSIWSASELREHEWNPMHYNVGNALYSLLAREYAPLPERLKSLKQRLEGIPEIIAAAKTVLSNPPEIHTRTAILQNDGAISLIRKLDEMLGEAPEMEEELAPAREQAIKVLVEYGIWLRQELLPQSRRDFRIGEEKYRKKLSFMLHSDLSMEEILSRAQQRLAELQAELYKTALPLYQQSNPGADNKEQEDRKAVIRAVLDELANSHPTDKTIVDDAKQCLEEVTAFTREKNLVTVPEEPLQIILMPEFRRGVSTAYCDSPGPLEKDGETFYAIAPTPDEWSEQRALSFYREYNDYMLQDLSIHEAIPGHYLQIAHSNRLEAPTLLRAIFYSGSFVEGWAVYAEQVMAEHGYGGAQFKMQQLKMLTRAVINSILDQKIHAGTMTEQEAMDMMMLDGYQEEGEAAGKWKRAQLTSTQLSTYFVGIAEHNDIRNAWEQQHGKITDWKAYHDHILSFGSPPAKFVRSLIGL